MKIGQKKIISSIVLLMGMLLCCAVYFEQSNNASLLEVSAENISDLECIDLDLDPNEEIQIISTPEGLSVVERCTKHSHFHFIQTTVQPFYPVWQPPKLS